MGLRSLSHNEKSRLQEVLKRAFGYELSLEELNETINLYLDIEGKLVGRIAGDIHDIVLNYFIRKYANQTLRGDEYTQCEIGVLFGGSTILGFKAIQNEIKPNKILVVDPLDGYYMSDPNAASPKDSISGCEITLANVHRNFEACNVDKSKIELVQDYSTSSRCIEKVRDRKFSFLFIDGDHTESGIRNDWDYFASNVASKGIVVIDNINDWSWREVNEFVYKLLKDESFSNDWGVKLFYRRTIVLQRNAEHDPIVYEALKSSMKFAHEANANYNRLRREINNTEMEPSLGKKLKRLLRGKTI